MCDWPQRPLLLSSKCQRLLRELLIQTFFSLHLNIYSKSFSSYCNYFWSEIAFKFSVISFSIEIEWTIYHKLCFTSLFHRFRPRHLLFGRRDRRGVKREEGTAAVWSVCIAGDEVGSGFFWNIPDGLGSRECGGAGCPSRHYKQMWWLVVLQGINPPPQ